MYCSTRLFCDWLTENAPYPACHWNNSHCGLFVFAQSDDARFIIQRLGYETKAPR